MGFLHTIRVAEILQISREIEFECENLRFWLRDLRDSVPTIIAEVVNFPEEIDFFQVYW